jgi:thiamine biosynthesis lipoprotein
MTAVSRPVMGMPVSVDIRTPAVAVDRLVREAFAWLSWVDATFSTYRDDSEVSRIGRGELDPCDAHPAVRKVLADCHRLAALTDGYFDAWVGGRLDPSGYVKGWAGERLSRVLYHRGATDHCVNLGGDVRVRGQATPRGGWQVGIRDMAGRIARVVVSDDLAVATSGAYERGSHILNPRNREPAAGFGSVTVLGPDLGVADAFATALFAAGDLGLVNRLPAGYSALSLFPGAAQAEHPRSPAAPGREAAPG